MFPQTRLCLLLALIASAVVAVKPTKVYLNSMEAALEAESDLYLCRAANATERLKDRQCFVEANNHFPFNATWWKQQSALEQMSALIVDAANHVNRSAYVVLEANGFIGDKMKDSKLTAVTILKLYARREALGGLQLGLLMLSNFSLRHHMKAAKEILEEFVVVKDIEESENLFRQLGLLPSLVKVQRHFNKESRQGEPISGLSQIAEELPFAIEFKMQFMLSGALLASHTAQEEATSESAERCGGAFLPYSDRYTVSEVVRYFSECVLNDPGIQLGSEVTKKGKKALTWLDAEDRNGATSTHMSLLRVGAHTLAAVGATKLLEPLITKFPDILEMQDALGRTVLFYAVANQHIDTTQALLRRGASVQTPDASGMPLHEMACSSLNIRVWFQHLVPPGTCDGVEKLQRFDEDEDDDCDMSGGGWAHAKVTGLGPSASRCPFDIQAASGIQHIQFVGKYVGASTPLVLRGVPRPIQKILSKKALLKKHKDILFRKEAFPRSEHFGVPVHEIITLSDALEQLAELQKIDKKNLHHEDTFFVDIEVSKRHPLYNALVYVPKSVVPGTEESFTTATETIPHLVIASPRAATNFAVFDSHMLFNVVHGIVRFTLVPPGMAMATKEKVTISNATLHLEGKGSVYRCVIHSGDTLAVPQLWAVAYESFRGESVLFTRRFFWK